MRKFKVAILFMFLLGSFLYASKAESYSLPMKLFINIDSGKGLLSLGMSAELVSNDKQHKDKITGTTIDQIVKRVEKKSIDNLSSVQDKIKLKKELKEIISQNLIYSSMQELYFTEFHIQSIKSSKKKKKIVTKKKKAVIVKDAYPEFVEELYDNSLRYYKSWKRTKEPKMYHKALFYIDSAITIEPSSSDLWFLKGMIQSETKTPLQLELALTSFIQAIIIRPEDDPAQIMVAQTLFNLGRYEEAIVRYKWIFETYKKEAMNYITLYPFTVSHLALGKKGSLLKYFNDKLSVYDEQNEDILLIRAVIYKNAGYKKEAIGVLKKLIDIKEDGKKREYFEFLLAKYKGDKK